MRSASRPYRRNFCRVLRDLQSSNLHIPAWQRSTSLNIQSSVQERPDQRQVEARREKRGCLQAEVWNGLPFSPRETSSRSTRESRFESCSSTRLHPSRIHGNCCYCIPADTSPEA